MKNITEEADHYITNVVAKVVKTVCYTATRRLLTNLVDQEIDFNHRRLPSSSYALDFSVVISGEYRPEVRAGKFF